MGIKANEKRIEGIKDFPVPQKLHSFKSLIELCSYLRRFIKDFSPIAKSLNDIAK